MRLRNSLIFSGLALALLGGYFVAKSADTKLPKKKRDVADQNVRVRKATNWVDPAANYKTEERTEAFRSDDEAMEQGALVGQRALTFKDKESMEEFLKRASGHGLLVMGRIDALFTLRIGFLNYQNLQDALDGSEELSMIFPVTYPEDGAVAAQAGAVPFGAQLLSWLGINTDNSNWGAGVKIAILDTGVSQHPSFATQVIPTAFGDQPAIAGDVNGHGTAVASMIAGTDSRIPGVAPAATILSVAIADANGSSDSYTLAQGIIAAVDAGVNLINISMGSTGDSGVVRNAVAYAEQMGVLIVAAAGNNGSDSLSYPSANDGVISVGAVDANESHLAFSNSGDTLALSAPGYGINAAWTDGKAMSVSGTSFSSPIVTGLIAATMTSGTTAMTATQAYQTLIANVNEAGAPGYDAQIGAGIPNMGRVLNAGTPGIYDAAVASNWISSSANGTPQLQVTIQNRGTETLINTGLSVTSVGAPTNYTVTTLAPGAIQTFNLPIYGSTGTLRVDSTVNLSGGVTDVNRGNDRRLETLSVQSN
ncbi:S8 family serine peptidase [Luteolibacter pohnpeiensis]|uniref:S8 family serine peptidase n=1 Tax=Luteolibacter pohnpeiensis TaxID=454153 RepID=A0A934S5R1_9BACT|nr:S8 family serine peptidase [Luteolibacter pohnpeiensis]MBK1883600.1 S8 family serine peptidase [Luteolibacter pohnpeiensis]